MKDTGVSLTQVACSNEQTPGIWSCFILLRRRGLGYPEIGSVLPGRELQAHRIGFGRRTDEFGMIVFEWENPRSTGPPENESHELCQDIGLMRHRNLELARLSGVDLLWQPD